MLTPSTIHVDQALSQISVAYTNPDLVAEELFPVVPVDKQSDLFFKFSKQHFRSYEDAHRPGADVNEIPIDMDDRGNYFCDGHALDYPIPDAVAANADPGADLDIEITLKVTEAIRLNEEINAAAKITTANISQNETDAGITQWTDFINSDPFVAVDTAKSTVRKSTGLLPNRLLLSEYGYLQIRNHPKLIDRVKYTQTGARRPLTPEELGEAFGVEKVVVAGALKQTAAAGRADALDYIWGKDALLFYRPATPSKRTAALGYTFVWMVKVGADGKMRGDISSNTGGFLVRRYRYERRRSDVIGVEFYYDQNFIDTNAAYLFHNVVA